MVVGARLLGRRHAVLAAWLPEPAGPAGIRRRHSRGCSTPLALSLSSGAAGLWLLLRWRGGGWRSPLGGMLLGLAGSALLAAALAAAQLLPVIEFTQQTVRAAGEGPHDIYPFSLEPFRLAEMVWPSVFGTSFGRNAYWIDSLTIPGVRQKIWVPSLYLGLPRASCSPSAALTFRRGQRRGSGSR